VLILRYFYQYQLFIWRKSGKWNKTVAISDEINFHISLVSNAVWNDVNPDYLLQWKKLMNQPAKPTLFPSTHSKNKIPFQ
jgi:hypothetical protein